MDDPIMQVLLYHLTPDMTVFDVGANLGSYTRVMLDRVKRVVAFEPLPSYADRLKAMALPGLTVEQMALSSSIGQAKFFVDTREGTHAMRSTLLNDPDLINSGNSGEITVKTTTLDDYVNTFGIEPDFIKIDVEGWEPAVLAGAAETIATLRPVVLFEMWETHYARYRDSFQVLDKTHHLVKVGTGDAALPYYEAELRLEAGDVLCIPRPAQRPARAGRPTDRGAARLS